MADRTSASLFERIFNHLAKNPTEENKTFAREIAQMTRDYDFNNYQMYADAALITLGLAHMGPDPDDECAGEIVIYDF